ncbi:MAG: cytochrome c family protein [Rhodovibrionaceae bacterium]|nr:cytochrome c family protein [Rhodovibrionaceae bacterium]
MLGSKMRITGLAAAAALTLGVFTGTASAEGDPEKGEKLYRQCKACHVVDKEQNRVGPHLVGLFGREAGSVEGFKYSDAMKESGIVWDEETIGAYLADPKGYIPGNRMPYAGMKDEQDRADIIAYMKEATATE